MNRKEFFGNLRKPACRSDAGGAKQQHISGIMKIIYSLRYVADVQSRKYCRNWGDPHLIAKTLIDTDDGSTQEDYGGILLMEAVMAMRQSFLISRRKDGKKVIDLSTWHGRAVVIAAAAVIIVY